MNSLAHIVPQLPPAIDGVGDYCWNLRRHWPKPAGDWQFLVARGADETRAAWPDARVNEFSLNSRSLAESLAQTQCDAVVLHYVGYAYQPKGIPLWLPRALAEWRWNGGANHKSDMAPRRLVVMFHEMYARSAPWRSPFWVAPLARRIIRELVAASDAWITSCERYFNDLVNDFGADAPLGRIVPIASNIPPAEKPIAGDPPLGKQRVVIFGLAKTRLWALERHWHLLRELHGAGLIEHITLLGKSPDAKDQCAWHRWAKRIGATVRWRQCFDLSPPEISRELAQHEIGLLANEPDILTKSGAFAALATHGVVPVISVRGDAALPPSLHGTALINDDDGTISRLIELLRDSRCCGQRRSKLLEFAARDLAWTGIVHHWMETLARAASSRPAELVDSPAAIPMAQTLKLAEGRPLRSAAEVSV